MFDLWFTKTPEKALQELRSDIKTGLDDTEIPKRINEFGYNELSDTQSISALMILLHQFHNPLLYILMIGAGISYFTGHTVDAVAIICIVIINAMISFWQELKAQRSLEALKEMAAPTAEVLRSGEWKTIPARELVPGDILKINTGDILGADVRILEANRLQIDEAALTGESEPVDKNSGTIEDENTVIGDRLNMGFMSTIVTGGNGIGVVAATGMHTEVGHIANMMANTENVETPMQRRMKSIAKLLVTAALVVVSVIMGIGIADGMPITEILSAGISLSVAAIPEGLPTIVTIVLTVGSQRMAQKNALAKQLSAIETLGSVSIVCSDKTGTLTQNQMQVMKIMAGLKTWEVTGQGFDPKGEFVAKNDKAKDGFDDIDLTRALRIAVISNSAELIEDKGQYSVRGNPTEGALVVAAKKANMTKHSLLKQEGFEIVQEYPFDSTRKRASVVVKNPQGVYYMAVKGAPDVILGLSNKVVIDEKEIDIDESYSNKISEVIDSFAAESLRTLALAARVITEEDLTKSEEELEKDLGLFGIVGIMDPPRPEVKGSIEECVSAGIKPVMITGDHAVTAQAIAENIGIKRSDEDLVVTGPELDNMSDEDLVRDVSKIAVFARVSPEHKLRIVKAQQENNHVTAMTGDGVNDAPALRRADIGVAMGITGTSVAKDSGDLILLDDNFSTIVTAIRQGRRIYDNLRKFIRQELTTNVGEISTILFAFLFMGSDVALPLTPLMILWINLVSDGMPALALGFEPAENDIMQRKPRPANESFFANHLVTRIITRGLTLGGLAYYMFQYEINQGMEVEYAQSVAFITLVMSQLWHLFDSRTFTTLYRKNPFSNKYVLLAVFVSLTLSLGVVYTSIGQMIFNTRAIELNLLMHLVWITAIPTLLLSAVKEVFKLEIF